MIVPYSGGYGDFTAGGITMAPGGEDAMTAGINGAVTPSHLLMAAMDMRSTGRLSQIYAEAAASGTKPK